MAEIGYALSSEEHSPNDLVRYAQRAEEIGFSFALISDHFHPWIDRQGHSPLCGVLSVALPMQPSDCGWVQGSLAPLFASTRPLLLRQPLRPQQ